MRLAELLKTFNKRTYELILKGTAMDVSTPSTLWYHVVLLVPSNALKYPPAVYVTRTRLCSAL